jgi:hypothetical protein
MRSYVLPIHLSVLTTTALSAGCASNASPGFATSGSGSVGSGAGSGSNATSGSSESGSGASGTGASGTGGSSGGAPGGGIALGDGGISGGGYGNCAPSAALPYVITDTDIMYLFDPAHLMFTKIGPVTCAGESANTVNSMAIDRQANAYVNFTSGHICKCSTTTPVTCQPTSFVPNQGAFTNELGMGFSADAPGSNSETLFVSDNTGPGGHNVSGGGKGLGKIDLTTMRMTPLGVYTGVNMGYNAELAGTGDAKLYGFFTTAPGDIAQIDKTTGATPLPLPVNVNASTGGYAFSFWSGDFWIYTDTSGTMGSAVTHYVTATKSATIVLSGVGFTIVGAGVSTCAPIIPAL